MTDSIHNILLVGAGQLGSRHLQGLARINIPVSIEVIDPSEVSLRTARERFTEIAKNPYIREIRFNTNGNGENSAIDLAVIATGADVRADVVTALIGDKQVRNIILEKFLFQRESDFERVGALLHERQVKAVVNCPRRVYPFYLQLKEILIEDGPINFRVDGSNWGLGCNGVHFFDLFAFLTGEYSSIRIDEVLLDNTILESKRPSFVEFTGSIRGANGRGDMIEISSSIEPGTPLHISIGTGTRQIEIQESAGTAFFVKNHVGKVFQETFTVPFQSQITGTVAQEMLMNGACSLTPYKESVHLHLQLLKTLLAHLNNVSGKQYENCPIT
ncbi:hypothetical protein DBW_1497 [Desulfuromonas sp. DDH964]|uniref:hypothetical protein n=1 Tax=Desulfuromonas sp. DDH964 TaxID=1823759 RepID=UPI00078E6BCA|nr:hypothetical protein [Desulfuromonas sp. DDH964]AMV71858.1 hypothetical protein DBW_1497 [Desulfuromonas sp. DDH964]